MPRLLLRTVRLLNAMEPGRRGRIGRSIQICITVDPSTAHHSRVNAAFYLMARARRWNKNEDDLLRETVSQQESNPINWQSVAKRIPGRTNKDCRKRWVYSLAPSIHKGTWENREDALLQEGVERHGTRWASVALVVGSRQPDRALSHRFLESSPQVAYEALILECSKRWHEVLKPDINRDRWSFLEVAKDGALRNAVRAHGRAWIEIVERYFPERTPTCVRNRYDHLTKTADKALSATPHALCEDPAFSIDGSTLHRISANEAYNPGCNSGMSEGRRRDEVTDHSVGQRTGPDRMNAHDAAAPLIFGFSSSPSPSLPYPYTS